MPHVNTSVTLLRRTALVSLLAILSACGTSYGSNNPDDLYSSIYKHPPTPTIGQDLTTFSNGDLL